MHGAGGRRLARRGDAATATLAPILATVCLMSSLWQTIFRIGDVPVQMWLAFVRAFTFTSYSNCCGHFPRSLQSWRQLIQRLARWQANSRLRW